MIKLLLLLAIVRPGVLIYAEGTGKYSQLCPVGPELAYTTAHTLKEATGAIWVGQFDKGRLDVVYIDFKTDVAKVRTVDGAKFPEWYVVGKEPEVGSRLTWRGEAWYAKGWYIDDGLYYGIADDGDLAFGRGAHPGMSGSCVFNAKQEAVGVLTSTYGLQHIGEGVPVINHGFPLWKVPAPKDKK